MKNLNKKAALALTILCIFAICIGFVATGGENSQPNTAYAETTADYTPLTESVTAFASGTTYSIADATQLNRLAMLVNSGQTGTGATFVLTDNITYTGENNYTPIGTIIETSNYPFEGTFDGQSHTVSGININDASLSYGGLFGFIDFATVKNVGVINSTITITTSTAVGAIVGRADSSTIENCYNTSALTTETSYIGGIVGLGYNLNIKRLLQHGKHYAKRQ
jgi:The GLUG motif.